MGHNVEKDEAYMRATMVEYIEKKAEAVTSVAGDFLKCKGQTLADYLHFIRALGNKGDELAVHILACMTNLKVVVVTKTRFWSTVMDCDPLSADIVLVYLGKSTFRDTVPIPIPTKTLPIPIDDDTELKNMRRQKSVTLIVESHDQWAVYHMSIPPHPPPIPTLH